MEIKSTTISAEHAGQWGFKTLASVDNPKASKATKFGFLNAILYMAPSDTADGTFNLCAFAGACVDLCLGEHSGQAAIGARDKNATIRARGKRALAYMRNRVAFLAEIDRDVTRLAAIARMLGLRLCYRFNGSTDVGVPLAMLRAFPDVTFIDYTKNPNKMQAYLAGRFPANYHVTFSYDPGKGAVASNLRLCERFIAQGGNVAIVGDVDAITSDVLCKARRVDGDAHDVRIPELDGRGAVVVLTPKGAKAKRDTSGFVVRRAA